MKKLFFILPNLFLFALTAKGQDVHLSQFYYSPLTLDPALTGDIRGNMRAVLNQRNQWGSVASPFTTSSISTDFRLFQDRFKGDALGAGFLLVSDKTAGGGMSSMQLMLSTAYHLNFGYHREHTLSLGLQSGLFQKRADYSSMTFGNQFSGEEFNTGIDSHENTVNPAFTRLDIRTGVHYHYEQPKGPSMNAGLAFFHINKPEASLLNGIYNLPWRSVFHWDARLSAGPGMALYPHILYMSQTQAREVLVGVIWERALRNERNLNINFSAGGSYRVGDALIFVTGMEYEKWKVNIGYDINLSGFHPASNYQGGLELSILYTSKLLPGKNRLPILQPCLRL